MFLCDYHTHTAFSCDSEEPLERMCETAIAFGLREIAVTDHADFLTRGVFENEIDLETRQKAIHTVREKFGNQLTIRNGIELGQPQANPEEYNRLMKKYSFDFIIGSIHNLRNDLELDRLDYTSVDLEQLYMDFLEAEMVLAKKFDFDVLGHITLPQRYLYRQTGKQMDLCPFEKQYKMLFSLLIERDKGIEVNTSGLYKGTGETLPTPQILRWYRECGGRILTVGSDAHRASDLAFGIEKTYQMLRELGFSHISIFENRRRRELLL